MRARDRADNSDSGIYALTDAQEAFAARALLARAAQHSLDVQYYIWRADKTGRLLLNELLMAADRGVQVRLLLDDLGTAGLDAELLALNAHPHVQVRLFNPFVLRGSFKLLGFVTEFNRTNRRMHNKPWTADRQASIVSGRNVGNEYFGATDGILFSDLDVITLGPVVQDIAQDFERYWRNAAAYPVEQVVTRAHDLSLEGLRKQGQTLMQAPASMEYRQAIASTPFVQQMLATTLPLEWAKAHLVSDPPEKIQAQAQTDTLIGEQMLRAIDTRSAAWIWYPLLCVYASRCRCICPVKRPRHTGAHTDQLTGSHRCGRCACRLCQAPKTAAASRYRAKTFAVDGERAFIGSFNFDPRSVHLNTEMGLMIESPRLAQAISRSFSEDIPSRAFHLSLGEDGQLRWQSGVGQPPPVYSVAPQTTWYQRWTLWLLGLLPIEWLL